MIMTDAETTPLYFRCHTQKQKGNKKGNKHYTKSPIASKSIVLAFDTETTNNQFQNLLFGSCGVWLSGKLDKFYIFYNDEHISAKTASKITKSWQELGVIVLTRKDFVEKVFFPYVFVARAKCVGFNLPFDLSRLAIDFGKSRKMHNGISLKLSENPYWPRIIVKKLDSKTSFIEFTSNSAKKKSEKKSKKAIYKGYFVDLKTLCFALTNKSYSLKYAITDFESPIEKLDAEHNGIFDAEYLNYNINDTLATYHLYQKALNRYSNYCLNTEENKLYSPASIGKSYLKKIGIKRFQKQNPEFPPDLLGKTMMTYYGGRTETRIRKEPVKVSYIDFTSMYPTIYSLMDMHRFLVADKIEYHDSTKETQRLLDTITKEDVVSQNIWPKLTTICEIIPDDDILPARAKYPNSATTNIGLNHVKPKDRTAVWYTIHDVIASKFLTGNTPKIKQAITFVPQGVQDGLNEIEVLKGIKVKPDEDFINKIINRRLEIKSELHDSEYADEKQKDLVINILKIIANSTSYGIYIQEDVEHHNTKKRQVVDVSGLDQFTAQVDKSEKTGPYFNPIMGVFLTAGSRLILGTAESLVKENDGYIAYCDTDSLFVSPEHVKLVQGFFENLNPYSVNVDMFKVEKSNDKKHFLDDVWCYAISAKRYVLYKYDEKNQNFTILKHSAHGLGHIENIDEIQWWKDVLHIHYHPDKKDKILAKYKNKVSVSSYTVSNYNLLSRFDRINKDKPYSDRIKPFNFFTIGTRFRQDPDTGEPIIPCVPKAGKDDYDTIQYREFVDYRTGTVYPNQSSLDTQCYWKPLDVVLKQFIDHKESKSEDGTGLLNRRHLIIDESAIRYIGKEANELEISNILGSTKPIEYKNEQKDIKRIIKNLSLKDALQLGLCKREFHYLKEKLRESKPLRLKKKTLKKLFCKSQFDYKQEVITSNE